MSGHHFTRVRLLRAGSSGSCFPMAPSTGIGGGFRFSDWIPPTALSLWWSATQAIFPEASQVHVDEFSQVEVGKFSALIIESRFGRTCSHIQSPGRFYCGKKLTKLMHMWTNANISAVGADYQIDMPALCTEAW
jgi:hypothetical protein